MISKEKWAEIILEFENKRFSDIISREEEIDIEMKIRRSISIIGPRRAGKTYEMYILIQKIREKYGSDKVVYINFERPDLGVISAEDLGTMLEMYYQLHPDNKKNQIWLFLDEIQNVPKWELFVRSCLDSGLYVYLSGSSSKLLSKEIATSMRGRNLTYNIYPFSFKEFLLARKFETKKYYSSSEKALLNSLLDEYLRYGGYPEAVLEPDKRDKIIKDIYDTAIYKDVIERGKVRNTKVLRLLIKNLLTAKEFSIHKFYNFIKSQGIKISKNSIYKYAELLSDAFFVFLLRKHDLSYKKSEQSLPKIYFIDNGLLSLNGIDDKGRLLENLVFIELIRRGKEISYYQNSQKEEVDFVVKDGKKVTQLIQVSYDISNFMTLDRELRVLVKASEEFNCKDLILINIQEEKEETVKGLKIKFIPLLKWLLNQKQC